MRAFLFIRFGGSAICSRKRSMNRSMSLAHKIIKRLMITTLVGSGVARIFGAAIETTFDQRTFTTQVEQIAPRLQSINAAVFNEFVADGGWLIIVFLLAQLGISVFTVRRGLVPLAELSALAGKI